MSGPILRAIFRAGRLLRWHANHYLSHTGDTIDGHAARVARIILALHPEPSLNLLTAALQHDDGEYAAGDIKSEAKQTHPELRAMLDQIETSAATEAWGNRLWPVRTESDRSWLHFADRLDAYMWADFHRPDIMDRDGWPEAWISLMWYAAVLRVDLAAHYTPSQTRKPRGWVARIFGRGGR